MDDILDHEHVIKNSCPVVRRYYIYCISDAVCLYSSGLLADADDQESFDLGLPFFELMTFNIFIVYTIDSYVEQTYLYKELRFGVQSKGKKKVTSTSLSVYCTIFLYLTHNKI